VSCWMLMVRMVEYALDEMTETLQLSLHSLSLSLSLSKNMPSKTARDQMPTYEWKFLFLSSLSLDPPRCSTTLEFFSSPLLSKNWWDEEKYDKRIEVANGIPGYFPISESFFLQDNNENKTSATKENNNK
jgi:hypothetical protein